MPQTTTRKIEVEGPLYDPGTLLTGLESAKNPGDARRTVKRLMDRGAKADYLLSALAYLKATHPKLRAVSWAGQALEGRSYSREMLARPFAVTDAVTTDMLAGILCIQLHAMHEKPWPNERKCARFFEAVGDVVQVKNFTLACLATLHYALREFGLGMLGEKVDNRDFWAEVHDGNASVMVRTMKQYGAEETLGQLLDIWSPRDPTRWYWLNIFKIVLAKMEEPSPALRIVTRLLKELRSPIPQHQARASLILQGGATQLRDGLVFYVFENQVQAEYQEIEASSFLQSLIDDLVTTFPHSLEARHAYVRWLMMNSSRLVEQMLTEYLYPSTKKETLRIPKERLELLEEIVEQLYGEEYWKTFCATKFPLQKGTPEEKRFREAQLAADPDRHRPEAAEPLEKAVDTRGDTATALHSRVDSLLDMLSGDVVRVKTTTHLQPTWMPVHRQEKDFFGTQVKTIELRRHPTLPERGPTCEFRFHLEGSVEVVQGRLDAEGNPSFDNILVLNEDSRTTVQTTVLEALADILVPSYVPGAPGHGNDARSGSILGELAAHQPQIHEEGIVGEGTHVEATDSVGRIHPTIALWLGEWLLSQRNDIEFDLFEQVGTSRRFKKLSNGLEELQAARRSLGDTFVRSVRAHTIPVGAKFVGEELVSRIPSAWSRENYDRYLSDGGRPLDFTPVPKTYQVPGTGERIVVNVQRTFNQGTFMTLVDALGQAGDPTLIVRVREYLAKKI